MTRIFSMLVVLVALLTTREANAQPALTTAITLPGGGGSSGNCAPSGPFLGESFTGTFTVQNSGNAPGFQPVLELYVPGNITLSAASFAEVAIAVEVVGAFSVATPSLVNPYSQETVTGPTGSTFVVLKMPLGTIATDAGTLTVDLTFAQSGLVLGDSRTVGGAAVFAFGAAATGSTPIRQAATNQTFMPVAYQVCKNHKGVSVTGPVDASAYTITVDVATGATLRNITLTDVVPASWRITNITLTGATGTVTPAQMPTGPGGTVVATLNAITGVSGTDATVTISGYYTDVLTKSQCNQPQITGFNTVTVTNAEYVSPSNVVTALPTVNPTTSYALRPFLVHQSLVACPSATLPGTIIPGTVFCMKSELLISDYHAFSTGSLVTRLPDGLSYDNFSSVDGAAVTPAVASGANGVVNLTLAVPSQIPAAVGPRRIAVIHRMKVDERYDNNAPVQGNDLLDPLDFFTADINAQCVSHVTTDKSGGNDLTVRMPKATFTKSIAFVNGVAPTGPVAVQPGDVVTFRLLATFPSGDDLSPKLVDFLPNPKFDAREHGTSPTLGAVGSANKIRLGAATSTVFRTQLTNAQVTLTTSALTASNSVTLQFTSFETNPSAATTLEVLMDYTATSAPMKNGLTLSNFMQGQASSSGTVQKVVSLTIKEPLLVMTKGVAALSADSNGLRGGSFDPAATFPATGTAALVDGDVTNLDGFDTVTFVIAIENQGDAIGYDLLVRDTPPNGWVAINTRVVTSDGVSVVGTSGTLATGLSIPSIAAKSATAKTDVLFVYYELVLNPASDIAGKTYTNTASLERYGGQAGVAVSDSARNFLKTPLTDTATMAMRALGVTKVLVSPASNALVQIGDELTYRYDLDVPEGTHTSLNLLDTPTPLTSLVYVAANGANTVPANVAIAVPAPTISGGGGWTYTFGSVVNSASTKANEVVQIPIRTRVANVSASQNAIVLANKADLRQSTAVLATGNAATVTIREPTLTVSTSSADTSGSLSATRTFTGTITNGNASTSNTAYDAVYTITLPAQLSGINNVTVGGTAAGTCSNNVNGQVLTITCTQINVSQTVTFSFVSTVTSSAPIAAQIQAPQRLTWTSRSGVDANERTGVDGTGQLNDYVVTSNVNIQRNVALAKTLATPAVNKYAIGASFEYLVTLTIPVGTANAIAILDTIPTNLTYVGDVAGSFENLANVLCNNVACTLPAPTISSGRPTWTFNTVSNASVDTATETVRWRILVQVANVLANQKGTVITNVISGGGTGNTNGSTITVLEPIIVPTLAATVSNLDGGDSTRVTLALPNTGDSGAFETTFSVDLASARVSTPTNVTISGSGCTFVATPTVVAGALTGTVVKVDPAVTCNVAFDAVVDATVPVAATQVLRATITYTSLSGAGGVNDGPERTGAGGAINDYVATATLNLVVRNGSVVKSQTVTSSTATSGVVIALGETATFQIRVNLAEGTVTGPVISDTSSGLRVTAVRLIENPANMTGVAPAISGTPTVGGPALINLGTSIVNPADNVASNDYLLLEVDAIGAFALSAMPATPHQNVASLSIGGAAQGSSTVALDLGTPQPLLAVSATPSSVLVGGTLTLNGAVTNTGDAPACDSEILVTVPVPFEVVLPVAGPLTYEAPNKVHVPITGCLAPAATINYSFSVRSTASAGGVPKDVTAALQAYKSLPAGDGPVTIDPANDGFDNDGVADADDVAVVKIDSNAGPTGSINPVYAVTGTTSVTIVISSALTDADGDAVSNTLTIPAQPPNATVTTGSGTITYTPSPNTTARTVTFDVRACDTDAGAQACALFPVTVTYNDPPTLTPVTQPVVLGQSKSYPVAGVVATTNQNVIQPGLDNTSLAVAGASGTYGTASVATTRGGTCAVSSGSVVYTAPTAPAQAGNSDSCNVRLCELLPGPAGVNATNRACGTTTYTFPLTATYALVNDTAATQKNTARTIAVATLLSNDQGYDATTFALPSGTTAQGGTVTVNDGVVSYAPANNYTGIDTFTYRVCPPSYSSVTTCSVATVTVTVNAPPVITPTTYWTVTGTASQSTTIGTIYSDPDNHVINPATVRVVSGPTPTLGANVANASVNTTTGAITITPVSNTTPERYTVEVEACDSFSAAPACGRATLTYVWNDTPVPPAATLTLYVSETYTRTITDVLANTNVRQIDGGLDATSVAVTTGPCTISAGSIRYTAPATAATTSCVIRVCESNPGPLGQTIAGRACGTNTWSFNVVPTLATNPDAYATPANTALVIPYSNGTTGLLDNDTGEAPAAPTAINGGTGTTSAAGGTVEFGTSPTGSVSYLPPAGFTGVDTFQYRVCDQQSPTPSCANVTVSVNVNAPPTLTPNTTWIAVGTTSVSIDIAALYRDGDLPVPDPIANNSIDVTAITGGATTLDASDGAPAGTIVIRPTNPNTLGTYVATVQACDDDRQVPRLSLCTTTTVTVRVNDPPRLVAQARTLLPNASGTFAFEAYYLDNGTVTATIDGDANGIEEALTGVGASLDPTASFTNTTPLGTDGACTLAPASGDVVVNAPTSPGTYTCYARVCEELPAGDPRVCSVTPIVVTVPAGKHDAIDDRYVTLTGTAINGDVGDNDTATVGGDPTVALITGPTSGTLALNADGSFTYTPNAGFAGTDSFVYESTDSYNQVDRATVTVVVNDPPVGPDERREIPQGGTYASSLDLIATRTNQGVVTPGIDLTSIGIIAGGDAVNGPVTTPLGGTCTLTAGAIVYTTPALSTGVDTCTIQVCELEPGALGRTPSGRACDTFTWTFDLRDDFDTSNDSLATIAGEAASVTIAELLANDDSEDAATFRLDAATSAQGGSVVRGANGVVYTPAGGFCGDDSFGYTVCSRFDATLCISETVAVDVDCIPTLAPRTIWVVIGTPSVTAPTAPAFADADNDGIGSVSVAGQGGATTGDDVVFTPANPNTPAQYDLIVRVCDDHTPRSACTEAPLTIIYNDPPTLPDLSARVVRNAVRVQPLAQIAAATSTNVINGGIDLTSAVVLSGPCVIDLQAGTGTFTAPNTLGPVQCNVRVCESNPGPTGLTITGRACSTRTWTFTIVDVFAPDGDQYATPIDTALDVALNGNGGLLDNDTGEDIATFRLERAVTDNGGRIGYDPANGVVHYVPPAGFIGYDSFTYRICDEVNGQLCESVPVRINVNAPPVTTVATRYLSVGTPSVTIDLLPLVTDGDPTPDPIDGRFTVLTTEGLTMSVVGADGGAPPHTLIVRPTSSATAGVATITYRVCDVDDEVPSLPLCTTGTLVVLVNDPPTVRTEDRIVLPGRLYEVALTSLVTGTGDLAGDDPTRGTDAIDHTIVRVAAEPLSPASDLWTSTIPLNGSGSCTVDAAGDLDVRAPTLPGTYQCFVRICEDLPVDDPGVCSVATIEILVPSGATSASDDAYYGVVGQPITVAATGVMANDSLISVARPSVALSGQAPNPVTQGTLVLGSDGAFTFTPVAGFAGVVTYSYTLSDGFGQSDVALVTLTINDPPTIAPASQTLPEGATIRLTFSVFADLTTQGVITTGLDETSFAVVSGPCTFEDGVVVYRSPVGENSGSVSCDVRVCELLPPGLACGVGTYTFVRVDDFDPRPDSFATSQDTALPLTRTQLLANDDSVGPAFSVATTSQANGQVAYDANGGDIRYTPAPAFCGPDVFTYTVCDRFAPDRCEDESVTVRVNCRPTLADRTVWVVVGTDFVDVDLQPGFADRDDDALDPASITATPVAGGVITRTGSTLRFTPNDDLAPGRYTYRASVCDDDVPTASCTSAAIEIIYNDPPTLPTLNRKIAQGQATTLAIARVLELAQTNVVDGGLDASSIALAATVNGTYGAAIVTNAGGSCRIDALSETLVYTAPMANGTDNCFIQFCEANPGPLGTGRAGRACTTSIGTFTIVDQFAPNNDVFATPRNTPLQLSVTTLLANDFGAAPDLTLGPSANGATLTRNGDAITYTPPTNFIGVDTFTYQVCDEVALTTCETVVVVVNVNGPPSLGDSTRIVSVGTTSVVFDIATLYSDSDPTPDPLDVRSVRVLTVTGDASAADPSTGAQLGNVVVSPTRPTNPGTYVVTYEACDNDQQGPRLPLCDTGTLTVIVNDPPVVSSYDITLVPGAARSFTFGDLYRDNGVVTADDPADGDTNGVLPGLAVATTLGGTFGATSALGSDGTCAVTTGVGITAPSDRGTFTCWVRICEELPANDPAVCSLAAINVLVPTGATTAVDDDAVTRQGVAVSGNTLTNDTVFTTGTPAATLLTGVTVAEGTLVFDNGAWTFTPAPAFVGVVDFTYRLSDGLGASDDGTVTIIVNDPPVLGTQRFVIDPGASTTTTVTSLITSYGAYDGGLGPVGVAGPCTVSDGTITLLTAAIPGTTTCTVTICEAIPVTPPTCTDTTVTIVVPSGGITAVPDSYATRIDTALTIAAPGVLGNDSVNSEGTRSAAVVTPSNGTLVLNPNGAFTYTPPAGFVGVTTFDYRLSDGLDHTADTTATIIVNDPPILAPQRIVLDPSTATSVPFTTLITSRGSYDGGLGAITTTGTCTVGASGINFTAPATAGTSLCDVTVCEAVPAGDPPCATARLTFVVPSGTLVANNDSYATAPGTPLTVPVGTGIAANDTVNSEGTKRVTLASAPPDPVFEGTLVLNPDGSFSFSPVAGYAGIVDFVYTLDDGLGHSAQATVLITVNDPPVLQPTRVVVDPNTSVAVPRGDYIVGTGVVDGGIGAITVVSGPCTIVQGEVHANGGPTASTNTCVVQVCEATPVGIATCSQTNITVVVPSGTLDANDESYGMLTNTTLSGSIATNDTVDSEGTKHYTLVTAPAAGALVLQPDGSFTYTPPLGFAGPLSFVYQLDDGRGHSANATTSILVNDPPILAPARVVLDLGTNTTLTLASRITSFGAYDGGLGAYGIVSGPCSISGTTITLVGSSAGTSTCVLRVCELAPADVQVCSATDLTIVVPTGALAATADSYATRAGEALTITAPGVLDNDTVNSEGTKTAAIVAGTLTTAEGTVVLAADGGFVYTPGAGFTGLATFDYTLSDGLGHSATATVTIIVNDPPVLAPDAVIVSPRVTVNVPVADLITNFGGYDGGLGTVTATGPCAIVGANVVITGPATPGNTTCSVTICEAIPAAPNAPCATTTIAVTVPSGTLAAGNDAYATTQDQTLVVPATQGVSANDTVDSAGTKSVAVLAPPSTGTLTLAPDGSFVYVPAADFAGVVTFTYTLSDGRGGSDTATVTITVNDPPTLTPVRVSVPTGESRTVPRGDYLEDFGVVDGGFGTIRVISGAACSIVDAQLVVSGSLPGTTSTCAVEVCEASPVACAAVIITVVVPTTDLTATDDRFETATGTPVSGSVATNDSVDVGATPTYTVVAGTLPDVAIGVVVLDLDGDLTFTPAPGFAGEVTFDYTLDDGNGNTAIGTVTIIVNDPPTLAPVDRTVLAGDTTTVPASELVIDSGDYDGTLAPGSGTSPLGADGTCTVLANRDVVIDAPSAAGAYTCEVTICELVADVCATTTISVTVPEPIAAVDDRFATIVGVPVTGNVLDNDDVSPTATTRVTVQPANGTVILGTDGAFTYVPPAGFVGVVTFTYEVRDGTQTTTAVVTIVVNDPPTLDAPTVSIAPGGSTQIPIADLIITLGFVGDDPGDGDNDGIGAVTVVSGPCTISGNDIVATAPNAATAVCELQICEEVPDTACATTTITIRTPITATDDRYYVAADTTLIIADPTQGIAANDAINSGAKSVTVLVPPDAAKGTLTLNADGTFTFTPAAGFAGEVTFTYTLTDGQGRTATATVTIIVNDGPLLDDQDLVTSGEATIVLPLDELAIGTGEVTADLPGDGDTDGIDQGSVGVGPSADGPFSDSTDLGDDGVCSVAANGDITVVAPSTPGSYQCWVQVCEELPVTAPRACSVAVIDVVVEDATDLDPDDDGVCTDAPVEGTCLDGNDNCPDDANADQADLDEDGIGDVCDDDADGDGIDTDHEEIGETSPVDPDSDDDGICDGPADPRATVPCDGAEDDNANGVIDPGESDPNDPNDPNGPPAEVATVLTGDGGCSGGAASWLGALLVGLALVVTRRHPSTR